MVKRFAVLPLILCVLLVACAIGEQDIKSFYDLTPNEKLTYMYQIYNAQHEDYVSMSKMVNLTEGQKKVMRIKKPILERLQVLIPVYDSMVQQGAPSAGEEQQIYSLLNNLQSIVPLN